MRIELTFDLVFLIDEDQSKLCKSWSWNLSVLQEAAGTGLCLSGDAEEEGTVT